MDDIKVTAKIDVRNCYAATMLTYYRLRLLVVMMIAICFGQIALFFLYRFDLSAEIAFLVTILGFLFVINPILLYFKCKRNVKNMPYFRETMHYTINPDKIEYKGDSIGASSNWQYITRFIERKDYFLLITTSRTFHYLSKAGFESPEDMERLRQVARDKSIKISYN